MRKLLKASFIRLFNSSEFQLTPIILTMINMVMFITMLKHYKENNCTSTPEQNILMHLTYIVFAAAMLVSLFVGTEYSNATIFNKIICGHSRTKIYFSYLLTTFTGTALAHLITIVVTTIVCRILLGPPTVSLGELASGYLFSLVPIASLTALFLFITVCIQNRAIATGISSAAAMVFAFIPYILFFEHGPDNTSFDFIPTVYLMRLSTAEQLIKSGEIEKIEFPYLSLIILAVFVMLGAAVFNRINIKNSPEGEI